VTVHALVEAVDWVNVGLLTLLGILALVQWRRGRGRAGLWAGLAFGVLALVADAGRLLPEDPDTSFENAVVRVLIAVLVLFPYLLYRFTTAFEPPTRRLERFVGLVTLALLVWTFLLPRIPEEGEPQSAGFVAYVVAFLAHWLLMTSITATRLWLAGRGHPGVIRRRMQLLSIASVALAAALIVSALDPGEDSAVGLALGLLVTASAILFLLGLAPPAGLRDAWRKRERDRLRTATAGLMTATSPEEVAQQVLPHVAQLLGARASALRLDDGEWIGAYHATDEMLTAAAAARRDREGELVRIDIPRGELVLWTTRYAPFFGDSEIALLTGIGNLTGLALDRSRLFAHEVATRRALERADEVKTNFVALAAHELRTPVASVKGIVDTLHARGDQLDAASVGELELLLRQQSDRMAALVEQLLDLSRLDAEAVPIHPQPLAVRQRVEELVRNAAGERRDAVQVDVPADLAALVDPTAFDRIVTNLVVNALRYGSAPVIVTAERSDRHFRLAVEDRGEGVPSEFVPDLFERFTRSEETRQRAGGSGLGLAIARSYAQAHRGDILYEHAKPHGARFQLVLPAE
jgi:two-component system sensor histidine kinase KdpD